MRQFLFASLLLAADVLGWSYDRCDTGGEPVSSWGGSCGTKASPQQEGTPINLCAGVAFPSGAPTLQLSGWTSVSMNVVNEGKTAQVNVLSSPPPTLVAGDLARIVGRTNSTGNATWALAQMHLHWGRGTTEGSEHWLLNKQYPLEAHFVHYNTAYGNSLSTALTTGTAQSKKDILLVVGVMFQVANSDVAFMKTMADNLPALISVPTSLGNVNPSQVFNGAGHYFSYRGSLTTPGCNEIVTWINMMTVKPITAATLQRFYMAPKNCTELQSKHGNYRPLQARYGRTLYSSKGPMTACKNVKEPTWSC